jgi:hypothetical protein
MCLCAAGLCLSPSALPLTDAEMASTKGGIKCETTEWDDETCDTCKAVFIPPIWVSSRCPDDDSLSIVCVPDPVEFGYECNTWTNPCFGIWVHRKGQHCDGDLIQTDDCTRVWYESLQEAVEPEACDP